jgi:2-hydroxychromene-2-carboxylate isomerase
MSPEVGNCGQWVEVPARLEFPGMRFYFDVGSPYAYLASTRIDEVIGPETEWCPVLLGGLFRATKRMSWAQTPRREAGMAEIEARASAYGLPPIRWPEPWPGNMLTAMRAAVAADQLGALRPFAEAAFRIAFVDGRDLGDPDVVAAAADDAGLDGAAVIEATQTPAVKERLRALTDEAFSRGVFGVPTAEIDGRMYWGDDQLEVAAAFAGR